MIRKSITALVLFASFAAGAADKTVTNKEFGFEITVPETWRVEHTGTNNPSCHTKLIVWAHNHEGLGGFRITVFVEDAVDEAAKKETLKKSKFKAGECYVFKPALTIHEIGRFPGVHPKEYKESRNLNCYAFSKQHSYFIQATCAPADYDKFANEVEAVVKSFKTLEAK